MGEALYMNLNGKLLPVITPIVTADSRALRYGDGLFETMKWKDGAIAFADDHFARLWAGMRKMYFTIPPLFQPEKLLEEIEQLCKKNKHAPARIRLCIFRGNGGLYDAVDHKPNYSIQTWQLPNTTGQLNENGLKLCLYKDAVKPIDGFANIKHNSFLVYSMAALYAKNQKCNDALVLNSVGNICDSTIANLFIIKGDTIYTPPLSEGCIAGITRKQLVTMLPAMGYALIEKPVSTKDVEEADEVFLTNAIQCIKWVSGFENAVYSNKKILDICVKLKATNTGIIC